MAPDDDEIDVEFEEGGPDFPYPDTLSGPSGEVFFYPDLGVFCEQHGAKAVQISEDGGIWLYPVEGGKPKNLSDWRSPSSDDAPGGNVKPFKRSH